MKSTKRSTILTVDDLQDNLDLIRDVLEDEPYEIVTARDGHAALDLARTLAPDLAILDVQMPEMDGYELCRRLRETPGVTRMPIIFFTAHRTAAADAVEGLELGASDYLTKPLDPEELRARVRALLRLRGEHEEAEFSLGEYVSELRCDLETLDGAKRALEAAESENMTIIGELRIAHDALEKQNIRLAELYDTAHQFVDNVSHEFRTPLTVIKEFAAIVRDGLAGPVTDDQCECLGIAIGRVDDLSLMVDDMLDISKLEAGLLRVARCECSADEIITRVRPIFEQKALAWKVSLDFESEIDLPRIYCDPEKIGRVIVNLGVNALKFCAENGRVSIRAVADPGEGRVMFVVKDNGPGIAPENLKPIFERFCQVDGNLRASTKGFGLGLNIAKELVHLNLGEMAVSSELGSGSTFSFSVPTAEPAALVPRFLERVANTFGESTRIAALDCKVDQTLTPHETDEMDRFLRSQVRAADLLFRVRSHSWLLIATVDAQSDADPCDAIVKARVELNRNRPAGPLPELTLRERGVWRADEAELVQRLKAQYRALADAGGDVDARAVLEGDGATV